MEDGRVDQAVRNLSVLLPLGSNHKQLVEKCREQRLERVRLWENANNLTVSRRINLCFAAHLLALIPEVGFGS